MQDGNRPPLGIMPKYLWQEKRLQEVRDAIIRHASVNMEIPKEWVDEYNELVQICIK